MWHSHFPRIAGDTCSDHISLSLATHLASPPPNPNIQPPLFRGLRLLFCSGGIKVSLHRYSFGSGSIILKLDLRGVFSCNYPPFHHFSLNIQSACQIESTLPRPGASTADAVNAEFVTLATRKRLDYIPNSHCQTLLRNFVQDKMRSRNPKV